MNVYDFDDTIFEGDSEVLFFEYLEKNKLLVPFYRIEYDFWHLLEKIKIIKYYVALPHKYHAIRKLKRPLNEILEEFWDAYQKNIKDFYINNQQESDIISSATSNFILEPIFKRLKIKNYITTEVDTKTMKRTSLWNKRANKVILFKNRYPDAVIDNFYSDSFSDEPMAVIAHDAWMVKGTEIIPWPWSDKR